ncbi:fimbrial biogenesis outer membrane usher protein [Chitinibacter bivalviorum]|uniref:Fimbrial biogenesis outer membrane usher protein n=1 Tax=Chitinibacter bivalviorum TaxID=2739434 RepID=A0A7H9BLJ1_9NEIS|nr:fimbrial biogenesis outer membrane usher protein [Chitinibacter bivalviorum]QLG89475.1 fimbrial biogenesis outer membrane usher protein [Chitinibacter bivalviorum]
MQTLIRFLLMACCVSKVLAVEPVLIDLIVNGVQQGDADAIHDNSGYWIEEQSLKGSGLNTLNGEQQQFESKTYYRADTLVGIQSKIDEGQLRIYLDAAASEFGEKTIALSGSHAELWPKPAPFSGYLSYNLAAMHQSDQAGFEYQFSPLINLNLQNWNFRSEFDYSTQERDHAWLRLNTTLDYDRPDLMLRATAGDLMPRSSGLSFSQAMLGVGVSRVFDMQPDFNSTPSFQTQTAITQPSTAEIYLNGQRIKTIDLQPGMYQFNDLRYYAGLQNVEVVIKDGFGSAQTVAIPYYFDDTLLKAGLSEFNYNLGVARVNGSFDRYDGLAYSLFHRVGVTDWFTLGGQINGNPADSSYGVLANFKLGNWGTLASLFSWAQHDSQPDGNAQQLQYSYINRDWSIYANAQRQSPNYWLGNDYLSELGLIQWTANVGASWGNSRGGNWNVQYGRQKGDRASNTFDRYQVGYSISPFKNTSISSQIQLIDGETQQWSGFVNVSWYFGQGHSLYGGAQYRNQQTLLSTTLSKSTPNGEGWGYSLSMQEQEQSTDYIGWLERKMRHGQANVSVTSSQNNGGIARQNWRASWQGALAYADGHFDLTRPITDSFAVVELDQVADVGIMQNGGEVGKTNDQGVIFIPEISSYSYQQITLKQDDLPIEYSVDRLQKDLLSGNHDGRVVSFKAHKVIATSGLILSPDGRPLANTLIRFNAAPKTLSLQTAMDGRFYTEALEPGTYQFEAAGCHGVMIIPDSSAVVTELAPITCTTGGQP